MIPFAAEPWKGKQRNEGELNASAQHRCLESNGRSTGSLSVGGSSRKPSSPPTDSAVIKFREERPNHRPGQSWDRRPPPRSNCDAGATPERVWKPRYLPSELQVPSTVRARSWCQCRSLGVPIFRTRISPHQAAASQRVEGKGPLKILEFIVNIQQNKCGCWMSTAEAHPLIRSSTGRCSFLKADARRRSKITHNTDNEESAAASHFKCRGARSSVSARPTARKTPGTRPNNVPYLRRTTRWRSRIPARRPTEITRGSSGSPRAVAA